MKLIVLSLIIISSQVSAMVIPGDLGLDLNRELEDSHKPFNLDDLDDVNDHDEQESPKSDSSDNSLIDIFEYQTPREIVMFIYNMFYESLTVEQVVADLKQYYIENIDREDADGFSALAWAYTNKLYNVMRVLLALDANANWQSRDNVPLLHSAIFDNDQQAFSILIEHGADMMLPGHNGATAFHITAQTGHELCYPGENLSLNKNPNTIVDMFGATLLHYAAWYGRTDMAGRLIDEGAIVNVYDYNHSTPLHYAAHDDTQNIGVMSLTSRLLRSQKTKILLEGKVRIAKILVRNHVDLMARNKDDTDDGQGCTALELARIGKNKKMVQYLETLTSK